MNALESEKESDVMYAFVRTHGWAIYQKYLDEQITKHLTRMRDCPASELAEYRAAWNALNTARSLPEIIINKARAAARQGAAA